MLSSLAHRPALGWGRALDLTQPGAGLQALFAGRGELIPGLFNKVSVGLTSVAPKPVMEELAAGIYEKPL